MKKLFITPEDVSRKCNGDDELIHRGDAIVRVNEQPFPIERDDLDLDWLRRRCKRLVRIECMRAKPGNAAQESDHERGDRPHDELEMSRESPVRQVSRARVGCTKPPGEADCREDYRYDDREHDRHRIDEDELLRRADRPLRVEHAAASCQRQRESYRGDDGFRWIHDRSPLIESADQNDRCQSSAHCTVVADGPAFTTGTTAYKFISFDLG
jgi:hypothetical protein